MTDVIHYDRFGDKCFVAERGKAGERVCVHADVVCLHSRSGVS